MLASILAVPDEALGRGPSAMYGMMLDAIPGQPFGTGADFRANIDEGRRAAPRDIMSLVGDPWNPVVAAAALPAKLSKAARKASQAQKNRAPTYAPVASPNVATLPDFDPRRPFTMTNRDPVMRGKRQRLMYPRVYDDPRRLAADANAKVAPESPLLKELFGVTRGELDEIGGFGRRQGSMDFGDFLMGGAEKPSGAKIARYVATDRNANRIVNLLGELEKYPKYMEAMRPWYVTDPIYWKFVDELGPDAGREAFLRQNAIMGLSSSMSSPVTEINRGSWANALANRGRYDDYVAFGGRTTDKDGSLLSNVPRDMSSIMGHLAHKSQAASIGKYIAGDGTLQIGEPKMQAYIAGRRPAALGHQTVEPVGDTHYRGGTVLLPDVSLAEANPKGAISHPERHVLTPWLQKNVGDVMGYPNAVVQPLTWGGYGVAGGTGVKGRYAPFAELVANSIGKAAAREGKDPQRVMREWIRGKRGIGATVPAAIGGGLLAMQPFSQPQAPEE